VDGPAGDMLAKLLVATTAVLVGASPTAAALFTDDFESGLGQ
jgi:hypothetical protein